MTCRMNFSCSRSALRRLPTGLVVTSAFAALLLLPGTVFGQNRFPTFGLPSSAYGVPVVRGSNNQPAHAPRSLSPSQTNGARMVSRQQPRGEIRPVAHSESANNTSSQQMTPVQRELQKLYEQNGREMPPMDMPSGGFQRPPDQQTSTGSTPKRSVVDLMKRQDTRFNTVQPQSSVRPGPTVSQQPNPPRTAAAVRPTDGRRTTGGVFAGIFDWGRRTPRATAPSRPPQEPNPYRPPTYQSQPQVRQPAPQTPQQRPATASSAPPRRAVTTPAPLKAPTPPQTPAVTKSFDLVPLTEPVLAPPAEDDFFPDDVAETTPQPIVTPQPKAAPQQAVEMPQVVTTPAQTPVVIPQPRNYARELGITPKPQQPAVVAEVSVTQPQPQVTPPVDDLALDNLFPEDEEPTSLASDDEESFQLPLTNADVVPEVEAKPIVPPPSPYTGRKLASGAFEQPMGSPNSSAVTAEPKKLAETTPAANPLPQEPAQFFPSDEHAIEADENLDISAGSLAETTLTPRETNRVATAVSHPSAGTTLSGSRMQQIAARDGVGLKGYCPVALRDERSLKDGKAAYMSFYHAKAYYFSTSEAKAAFDDNPDKYAPASHGNDVTLMALTGEVLEGSLENAVWYKDRLYLFSTAENLKTFMAAPSAMAVTQ